MGVNTTVSFDRSLTLANGQTLERVAFVEDHSVRAQLMYKLDSKGEKIQVDRRYLLLDTDQANRLRRVFEMIVSPRINKERLARAISGEGTEDLDTVAGQVPED